MIAKMIDQAISAADIATAREAIDVNSDVMLYEFRRDLNRYLAGLGAAAPVKSLRDVIRFNEARPREMLRHGQVRLLAAQAATGVEAPTDLLGPTIWGGYCQRPALALPSESGIACRPDSDGAYRPSARRSASGRGRPASRIFFCAVSTRYAMRWKVTVCFLVS